MAQLTSQVSPALSTPRHSRRASSAHGEVIDDPFVEASQDLVRLILE